MPTCSACYRSVTGRYKTGLCRSCAVRAANARRLAAQGNPPRDERGRVKDGPEWDGAPLIEPGSPLVGPDPIPNVPDPPEAPAIVTRLSGRGVPDIIEFVCDPKYLGPDDDISTAQLGILKAIYGMELTPEELEVFLIMTDGRKPRKGGYADTWVIAGRRSGKTDKILANMAVYTGFTFDRSALAPGETPFFPLIAQNVDGAGRARGYIEGKLLRLEDRDWDILDHGDAQQRAITGKEIRLTTGVVYRCFPCTKAAVRGTTSCGYGTDESAWWQTEEGGYNSDREVFRALDPTTATLSHLPTTKAVNVTNPYAEEGMVWEMWLKRTTTRALVLHATSWMLNPNLSTDFLERKQNDDPVAYLREYGAQFGKEGGGYFSPDEVERAIDRARPLVLPNEAGRQYFGVIDVGFKHDLYVALAARMEGDGVVVVCVKTWQGEKKRPLDGEKVAAEAAEMFRSYGIDRITTDQYSDIQVVKDYSKCGITVNVEPESEAMGFEKFKNLKAVIRRGLLNLPNDPIIRKDLLSLRQMKGGRHPKVAAPQRKGFHDDVSNALGKVLMKLLPISQRIDLSEINAAGMPNGLPRREGEESWMRKQREGEREDDFGGGMMERVF